MKYVLVTASIVGKTWLYAEIGPSGRRTLVPTYAAEMGEEKSGFRFRFSVTRDSAAVVFRHLQERYALGGECPPTKVCKPYRGRLRLLPRNGMSLILWEEGYDNRHTVRGVGTVARSSILIHRAPASSLGCMGIAGGRRGYTRWVTAAEALLPERDDYAHVIIEPRPEAHHTIHLSR
jgi:hypothetical protein